MALAMTNQTPIVPQAQQSAALKWASVLSGPVSSLGAMWLSNDSTKAMARYNRDTSLAKITAEQANTSELYTLMGSNSSNMMTLGLGSMEYINPATDYSSNFSNIDNYLLKIINNLNTTNTEDNQIWVPGVNCVNAANPSIIGVGGTVTVCPQ
tara:strand:- start:207 stop:665 length:459 start_codon:yes stop_codon:yes gene_type:complete